VTVATDVARAFASMCRHLPAQVRTLAMSNPTAASVTAFLGETRRISRDHDAAVAPSVEIEADFHVLPASVTLESLHPDRTTWSDGTYTWRLRAVGGVDGYIVRLSGWRAVDYVES